MVPADSHRISRVPRYSGAGPANVPTSPTRLSRSAAPLSSGFCCRSTRSFAGPTTPGGASPRPRFGLLRVRSPLLAESSVIFSSYGYLDVSVPHVRPGHAGDGPSARRVAPFGNPRINGYLLLPVAFRSLSRPSSPPRAKASTVCPCLLSARRT